MSLKKEKCIWVIDDDNSIRWVLERALTQAGFHVFCFENGDTVLAKLEQKKPDVIITDIRMPGIGGLGLLNKLQENHSTIPVIIMTAHSDLESAVFSYKGGAYEYLPKPFDIDEVVALVNRASEVDPNMEATPIAQDQIAQEIIGEAPAMQEVFRVIGRLTHSNITVLINGQSGTGKELVAQALHKHSPRASNLFIALNMAAIPKDLIESELFGHEKGAFTGALQLRKGRFEQADGGTLFLDEIGDMPLDTQTRLLRVLANSEFYRVGGRTPVKVDVRIITATHQNLETLVKQGKFREDLFHRINVIRIQIPSLNERREDIPKLALYFMKKAAQEMKVESKQFSDEALAFLSQSDFPGNVRQLENICRWITVMSTGHEVLVADLPPELKSNLTKQDVNQQPKWMHPLRSWADAQLSQGNKNLLELAVPCFERTLIEVALKHTVGKRRNAAELLGWGRNTLTRKIKELGMNIPTSVEKEEIS